MNREMTVYKGDIGLGRVLDRSRLNTYEGMQGPESVFRLRFGVLADTIFDQEGLQKPDSQQIPNRIKLAVKFGRAAYVVSGGKNVWPHVRR